MRKKRLNLPILACVLVILIGILSFLWLKVEEHVLASKQERILRELKQEFTKPTNTLDYTKITLGKPIAILEVPEIDLIVPVFYGTTDDVLNEGIGLLEGFSDLEGGLGKHPVLTGHNGLSAQRLFTRLDELKKGEKFSIITQKGKRTYEIDKLQVIKAETLHSNLEQYILKEPTKDQATLITCTPRNINSHRLLVTGQVVNE